MPEYIQIKQTVRDHILSEIKRTGIGPQRILKGNKGARELGLTSGIIYRITGQNGKADTAREDHIRLALELWRDTPDKKIKEAKPKSSEFRKIEPIAIYKPPSYGYEPITIEFLEMLKREELRTGIRAEDLVKVAGIDVKPHVVKAWKSGKTKSADPEIIKGIVGAFKNIEA